MEDAIGLRERLVGATGTFQRGRILFGMFGRDMDGESLRVEKLFLTGGARVREMTLVPLHMVVHRVLILLDLGTDGADKLAGSVLLIDVRHCTGKWGPRRFNFYVRPK
jgi:hypothetical protein